MTVCTAISDDGVGFGNVWNYRRAENWLDVRILAHRTDWRVCHTIAPLVQEEPAGPNGLDGSWILQSELDSFRSSAVKLSSCVKCILPHTKGPLNKVYDQTHAGAALCSSSSWQGATRSKHTAGPLLLVHNPDLHSSKRGEVHRSYWQPPWYLPSRSQCAPAPARIGSSSERV